MSLMDAMFWNGKNFLKASLILITAGAIALFVKNQITTPTVINLDEILAVEPNTPQPISSFLPENIEIICEFWAYTTADDFKGTGVFTTVDELGLLPIEEEELALVYLYENGAVANLDKIRRFSRNFQWSLSDLTTSENCYYTSGIEVLVNLNNGIPVVSLLRDANSVYQ